VHANRPRHPCLSQSARHRSRFVLKTVPRGKTTQPQLRTSCARESTPATTRDSATGCRGRFTPTVGVVVSPPAWARKTLHDASRRNALRSVKKAQLQMSCTRKGRQETRRAERADMVSRFRCGHCPLRLTIRAARRHRYAPASPSHEETRRSRQAPPRQASPVAPATRADGSARAARRRNASPRSTRHRPGRRHQHTVPALRTASNKEGRHQDRRKGVNPRHGRQVPEERQCQEANQIIEGETRRQTGEA